MIAALLSTRQRAALAVLGVAVATIGGAWIIEAMGFAPCELCLKQRIPYYAGIPLAAFAAIALQRGGEGPRASPWRCSGFCSRRERRWRSIIRASS